MKLALALTVAVAGCAATTVEPPVSPPVAKRWGAEKRLPPAAYARPRRGLPSVPASRSQLRAPIAHDWTGVANCESDDNWHIDTGNGYFGGLQESQRFWDSFGGLTFAPRPDLATETEQIVVAERGLAAQGVGAWPVCHIYLRAAA